MNEQNISARFQEVWFLEGSPEDEKKKSGFTWSKMSLRGKATLLAVAIAVGSVLLTGFTAYYFARQSLSSKISKLEKARVRELQNTVNTFMEDRLGDIQVMANLDIFRDEQLREMASPEMKEAALDKFIAAYKIYDSIAVFDIQGNPIVQTKGIPLDNHLDRTYIQGALEAEGPVISEPLISKTAGTFNIYSASLIKDKEGKKIGFIRARMPVEYLREVIKGYETNESQYYLVNSSGKVFLGPKGAYATKKLSTGEAATEIESEYEAVKLETIFPVLAPYKGIGEITDIKGKNTVTNTEQLIIYGPPQKLERLPDLKWSAIVATDGAVVFAPQQRLFFILTMVAAAIALLVGIFGMVAAKMYTGPILAAIETVRKLGRGQLDMRLTVKGEDELALLAANINLMGGRIRELLERQASENQLTELLARIARTTAEEELHSLLKDFLGKIRSRLNVERVVIYRFQEDGRGYISEEAVLPGWPSALLEATGDSCIPEELLRAYTNGRTVAIADVGKADLHPEHLELMTKLQVKSSSIAPIIQGDHLFGLLIAHRCERIQDWQEWERDYLKDITQRLGQALTGLALMKQREREARLQQKQNESIQRELLQLLSDVEEASSGNLAVRARITEDNIGIVADFFNAILENMSEVVMEVQQATREVNSSLGQEEEAMRSLAEESLRQAKKIKRMLEFGEEMTRSIGDVANNAAEAAEMARSASREAETGGNTIDRTVDNILQLRSTVSETAKKVKRLGESSQQISKVISLINQIALQTNLLAINASIEAARAGEEGSGFAVVAEEVGELATQSAAATKEIEQIVESIQAETKEVVEAMELGTSQVVDGTNLVEKTKQSLEQILATSHQIDRLFQSISQATGTQADTSQMIIKLMQEIAKASEGTSAASSQVSGSLGKTVAIAGQLQEYVAKFKVN